MITRRMFLSLVGAYVAVRGASSAGIAQSPASRWLLADSASAATAEQVVVDGAPQRRTTLRIPLPPDGGADTESALVAEVLRGLSASEVTTLAEGLTLRARVRDPGGGVVDREVPVSSVTVTDEGCTLRVEGPVSRGSRLLLDRAVAAELFPFVAGPTASNDDPLTGPPLSGTGLLSPTRAALGCKAYAPTNADRFSSTTVPGAKPARALAPETDEATVRGRLESHAERLVAAGLVDDRGLDALLARFDDPAARALCVDRDGDFAPTLLAAVLSASGTAFEPLVGAVLDGENASEAGMHVTWAKAGALDDGQFARVSVTFDTGALAVELSPTFRGEPFQVIGTVLAHEAAHQDYRPECGCAGRQEEVIGSAFQTLAYAQQVLVDPSLAARRTRFVKFSNGRLLGLLNSGAGAFPRPGLRAAPLVETERAATVVPGGVGDLGTARSLLSFYRTVYADDPAGATAGNAYLDAVLSNLAGETVSGAAFDAETVDRLDEGVTFLDAEATFALVRALDLSLAARDAR